MVKFNNHGEDAINSRVCFSLDDFDDGLPYPFPLLGQMRVSTDSEKKCFKEAYREIINIERELCTRKQIPIDKIDKLIECTKQIDRLNEKRYISEPQVPLKDKELLYHVYKMIVIGDGEGISSLLSDEEDIIDNSPFSYRIWMFSVARQILIGEVAEDDMHLLPPADEFSIDWMGRYISEKKKEEPYILICPDRISKTIHFLQESNQITITYEDLYAFILIFMLARAIMDPLYELNKVRNLVRKSDAYEVFESESDDIIMENSLATMITLQYFCAASKFDIVTFDRIRAFVKTQPLAYRFGLVQYEALRPDWRLWREYKSNIYNTYVQEK